jgi:hypothetical protein
MDMPTSRKRKHHRGTAGTRKTAQRKSQTPARRTKASGSKHRIAHTGESPSERKSNDRKTVRSSNKKRAAAKGEAELLKPGRGRKPAAPVINADSDNEVYGVMLSERARRGESKPRVPESKTRNTKSVEPKRTPPAKKK